MDNHQLLRLIKETPLMEKGADFVREHVVINGQTVSIQHSPYHYCNAYVDLAPFSVRTGSSFPITEDSTFEVYYPGDNEPNGHQTLDDILQRMFPEFN